MRVRIVRLGLPVISPQNLSPAFAARPLVRPNVVISSNSLGLSALATPSITSLTRRGSAVSITATKSLLLQRLRGSDKPSDGLEPSTPSLPCDPNGSRWQPVATVRPRSSPAGELNVCQRLRPLCSITVPSQSVENGRFESRTDRLDLFCVERMPIGSLADCQGSAVGLLIAAMNHSSPAI
jgi:hypothetical protein